MEGSMKRSKFSEAEIAFILRRAEEGTPVAKVCHKAGISDATLYIYGRLSRCKRFEQIPSGLGCQHLSGVARDAGAPKWVIRAT
jgi:putative transposase